MTCDQGTVLWSFFELIILLFKKMLLYLQQEVQQQLYNYENKNIIKSGAAIPDFDDRV